jgi:transketolase
MRLHVGDPSWSLRDRFVLSKGHAAPVLYAVLADLGYFPIEELLTLRQYGSRLQGHPDMRKVPGVEISTGSLGMGLSNAVGMAWAADRLGEAWRTFVLLGDGELNEGQNWEAAMLGAKLGLSGLTAIVDLNQVQLDGPTDDVMPLRDVAARFEAFGWTVAQCDGHDVEELADSFQCLLPLAGPKALVARTTKGKGVSFMEGDHRWHGGRLSDCDYARCVAELAAECA